MHNTSNERFFSFITTAVIFRNDSGILKFRSLDLSALSKPESPSDAFRFRKLSIKIREKATKNNSPTEPQKLYHNNNQLPQLAKIEQQYKACSIKFFKVCLIFAQEEKFVRCCRSEFSPLTARVEGTGAAVWTTSASGTRNPECGFP